MLEPGAASVTWGFFPLFAGVASSVLQIMGQMGFSLASVQTGLSAPEIQGPPSLSCAACPLISLGFIRLVKF